MTAQAAVLTAARSYTSSLFAHLCDDDVSVSCGRNVWYTTDILHENVKLFSPLSPRAMLRVGAVKHVSYVLYGLWTSVQHARQVPWVPEVCLARFPVSVNVSIVARAKNFAAR